MLSIVQRRKQDYFYTGHGIQQTPICIGQLCASYAIVSLLAPKPFTNLPRQTLVNTVEDLASKVTKSSTKPHSKMRLRDNTEFKVYKICYSHLDQGNIPMVTPPVPSVTRGYNHRWHLRKLLLNLPLRMNTTK